MKDGNSTIEVSEEQVRENFRLLTGRPITDRTVSVVRGLARIAQWHLVEALELGLLPIRVGNYYLIKAEVIDGLFKKLDRQAFVENVTEISQVSSQKEEDK